MNTNIQILYFVLIIFCNYSVNCKSDKLNTKVSQETSDNKKLSQLEKNESIIVKKEVDVNSTIAEVERILSLNSSLPRLSRTEILNILDNITKSDNLKSNLLAQDSADIKSREEHQRAIMYVMPYSPKNYSYENIQELFTKPPVVKIVDNNSEEIDYYNVISPTKAPSVVLREPTFNRVYDTVISNMKKDYEKNVSKTTLGSTSTVVNKFTRPQRPQKPQINANNDKKNNIKKVNEFKPTESTNYPSGFIEKLRNRTRTSSTARPNVVSTTARPNRGTIRYPNHKYPEEETSKKPQQPIEVIKIVTAPTISLEQKLTKPFDTDHWNDKPKIDPNLAYKSPETVRPIIRPSPFKLKHSSVYRTSTVQPQPIETSIGNFVKTVSLTTQSSLDQVDLDLSNDDREEVNTSYNVKPPVSLSFNNKEINSHKMTFIDKEELDIGVPEHLKDLIKNIDLNSAETQSTNTKYSSHYKNPPVVYPNKVSDTISNKNNVKEFQDSIGLFQDPVTTTVKPDWSEAVEGLDPEMKQLLMTFGLIPNPVEDQKTSSSEMKYDYVEPVKPVIQPASYMSFKPLPDTAPSREDMHSFLSKFGLMSESRRSQKSITANAETPKPKPKQLDTVPVFDTQMLPDNMKEILEDIGLVQPSNRKSKAIRNGSNIFKTQEKSHVFNPETAFASNEELKKLEQLISTIKQLDKLNGTVTQSDLDSLDLSNIKELTESLNNSTQKNIFLDEQETDNLSPLSLSEISNIFKIKSGIKRQNSNTSESSNSTETTTTEAITSTTEESRNPSAADLADSFGVNTDVSGQTVPDEALPEPRRSGVYFLVDWNSFLEVGDDERNKVNIRIAPRVGDPSRFINVKVP